MKLFLVVCLALVVVAQARPLTDQHYQFLFGKFQQNFNKVYSQEEEAFRFSNFKRNLDYIRAHNARSDVSFKLSMNHLGDLSRDEYLDMLNEIPLIEHDGEVYSDVDTASFTVDWRKKGVVSPVKNQKQCGSCWAFSATEEVESCAAIDSGKLVVLGPQELVDCEKDCYGCRGGWPQKALAWIHNNGGMCKEADYPYRGYDESCKKSKCSSAATCGSPVQVSQGNESALASAVSKRPISIAIDASHSSFQFYSGGVYDESSCSSTRLDHAVFLVGYGTDNGKAFWLVKNSWGSGWGVGGYIYMSKDKNNQCGVATNAFFSNNCQAL